MIFKEYCFKSRKNKCDRNICIGKYLHFKLIIHIIKTMSILEYRFWPCVLWNLVNYFSYCHAEIIRKLKFNNPLSRIDVSAIGLNIKSPYTYVFTYSLFCTFFFLIFDGNFLWNKLDVPSLIELFKVK